MEILIILLAAGAAYAAKRHHDGLPLFGTNPPTGNPVVDKSNEDHALLRDASNATAAVAVSLTTATAAISAADPAAIPFVGPAAATVGALWKGLSVKDKANVWRGHG